ncbi:hypothetical protein CASFOL_001538 [Castilleja foliolosa]|uniref:Uncharacterized protein n=1 Tax=Castilleja foliolosa TaxID=1961234 RepID=A0ABD3EJH5_9LAMI
MEKLQKKHKKVALHEAIEKLKSNSADYCGTKLYVQQLREGTEDSVKQMPSKIIKSLLDIKTDNTENCSAPVCRHIQEEQCTMSLQWFLLLLISFLLGSLPRSLICKVRLQLKL